jgi:hypothetical protein
MAFKTSQRGSGSPIVAKAFSRSDEAAIRIKDAATLVRDKTAADTVTASDILNNLVQTLRLGKAALQAAADTPGIGAYAASQYSDVVDYAVGAEFTAMMAQINTTIAFFIANYPNDSGSLRNVQWDQDNSGALVSYTAFTAPQKAAIITRLDALLATID